MKNWKITGVLFLGFSIGVAGCFLLAAKYAEGALLSCVGGGMLL